MQPSCDPKQCVAIQVLKKEVDLRMEAGVAQMEKSARHIEGIADQISNIAKSFILFDERLKNGAEKFRELDIAYREIRTDIKILHDCIKELDTGISGKKAAAWLVALVSMYEGLKVLVLK